MAQNGKKSKKKRIIILSIIGVVLIALIAVVFLGSNRERVISVQTEKVERRNLTQVVTASGKIQPEVQVKINAEVSGEIIELPVREGDVVRKGQLLVKIKPDAYQAQYERSQAAIRINEANLRKAEAEFRRMTEMYNKKLVSDAEFDITKATYESAKASYDQSQASVKEAKETLDKTTIYSPMPGVVSQLLSELGERVSGSTFTRGTEIMTIADLARMEARVQVGENDVVLVQLGDTARIEVDSYPNSKFIGKVTQIANTAISTGLGTQEEITNFEVRILIHQPDTVVFRPGMSMTADIETETRHNALTVPIQSVTVRTPKKEGPAETAQPGEGEARVDSRNAQKQEPKVEAQEVIFIVKNGKAVSVPVKRGISDDTHIEITQGAEEGMEVVSGPYRAINRELENDVAVKIENKERRPTGPTTN
jgi:HlyD family secretion protein